MEDTQGEVIFEPWAEETIELTSTPGICSNKLSEVIFSFNLFFLENHFIEQTDSNEKDKS